MNDHLGDSSLWVALALEAHVHHEVARDWLEGIGDGQRVFFCRATQQSFLRLITTASVVAPYGFAPLTNESAWAQFDSIVGGDVRIALVEEPPGVEIWWREFASRPSPSPKLWMDAYLAAFSRAGGYGMVTTDRAFRQFDGLDLVVLGNDGSPA